MKNKYDIINSITDKETKMVVANIYDNYLKAKEEQKITSTAFLNPNMVSIVLENFRDNEIKIILFGGYENAERVLVYFCPKKTEITEYFNIDLLKISYNSKYSRELKHSDFLGSILGLSIKRELIGDILLEEENAYIFVNSSISGYIIENLKKVGRTNIKIEKILDRAKEDINCLVKMPEEAKTTVTSLRVDVVLAKIYNISRGEIKDLFEAGKVFVNWVNVFDISKIIKEGDIITLRGLGRIKFAENLGMNKKGKITILYLKY